MADNCGVPDCEWHRVLRRGQRRTTLQQRLFARLVEGAGGCWVWTGQQGPNGYGQIGVGKTTKRVHRAVYEVMVGPIPESLRLDHLCRNQLCANPDHLDPVPDRVNWLRSDHPNAVAHRESTCKRGHSLDGDVYVKSDGARDCRACRRFRRSGTVAA